MRHALGKRINQLRKSKGLTPEQLSELCGGECGAYPQDRKRRQSAQLFSFSKVYVKMSIFIYNSRSAIFFKPC